MARKRIGELLVERGAISAAQLEEGLAHQKQSGQRLGVALIQKGFITEEQLASVLSEALGIPLVALSSLAPDWAAVHMLRARFCEQHELFPYALATAAGKKQLVVAMSDPLNAAAIGEIEFTTGLKVQPQLAPVSQVRAAILRYYHKGGPGQAVAPPSPSRPTAPAAKLDSDDEVIEGELLDEPMRKEGVAARSELEELVRARERAALQRKAKVAPGGKAGSADELSKDLDFLFGVRSEPDQLEQLEKKFWTLMRIMARKGLITKDEFAEALGEDES